MSLVKLDPEWAELWALFSQMPKPVYDDVYGLRNVLKVALTAANQAFPAPEGVKETKHTYPSLDGTNIDIHQFVPPSASTASQASQRAIVYAFGGGMIGGSVEIWRTSIKDLAASTGSPVFAVQYRLAPEHPAPAAVEDIYSAVLWLQSEAARFDIDPKRVVLFGGSAGGGLAAGAALLARDRGLPYPIAAMLLYYPMLDDRAELPDDHPMHPYLTYTKRSNDMAWEAVLGRKRADRTDENVPIYVAPARAKDLSGLPDTFIDIGGVDIFRDESIAFAAKLAADGVFVEFHLYPGVPHGFDNSRQMRVAQQAVSNRINFVSRY
ncbi:Alpha/Beta hydrolase protein [Poronia punctata]|nr:Alpha/Beta hydrolase protein [Poronia punctata]